ncbi:hypothetical protein GCM10011579_031710 [Streptomyces albiflavescens]|uniref:Uncharacterized protein n=1 Tax=Streptomyces albiflavescens TaxID=1623582 RepID=A0A917Y185_9ACTN|nr:hypothetical protein [Streptomyces albiflavescens]GGN63400.1 hypothetical protein GCM10011579_031710 [Streptomyces albiflavescens]
MTNTASTIRTVVSLDLDELLDAVRELRIGGRWERASRLLESAVVTEARARARTALAAAEVALESDWFGGTGLAGARLDAAEKVFDESGLDGLDGRWDLDFLRLRHDYLGLLRVDGTFRAGPEGKDPEALAALRRRAANLRERGADAVHRGWAEMYLGLIADNLFAERDVAPAHYEAALRMGESGDDLLSREALRHLGDHDHDRGDHARARERWSRATALGARAGTVPGTLSQQMLLAVLARDTGDEAGAAALAREIARWAGAIGATTTEAQANGFLTGVDPTAPPSASDAGR